MRRDTVATRLRIIETAQGLFAKHGFHGVSLREIAEAAGQRNTGAIQYHFGDRAGLITAIFDHGGAQISAARDRIVSVQGPTPTVHEVVEAIVLPFAEAIAGGSEYVSFLGRLVSDRSLYALVATGATRRRPSFAALNGALLDQLTHLPQYLREWRVRLAKGIAITVLATHQSLAPADPALKISFDLQVQDLIEMLTGLLTAPAPITEGRGRVSWRQAAVVASTCRTPLSPASM